MEDDLMAEDRVQQDVQEQEPQAHESGEDRCSAQEDERGKERLAVLQAELDEAVDRWKRTAADFDNFRKRVVREREELLTLANERLVKELLPILDDLERALAAVGEHQEATVEDGVRLVHRSLASLLERNGVREISADGKFDPHVHEALLSQPSDAEEGSVIDVVQKGYTLGDRVVRPARVVVAAPQNGSDG
jgi:molecular chaperone GrpE